MAKKKKGNMVAQNPLISSPCLFFTPFFFFCSRRIAFLVVCFVSSDKSFFFFAIFFLLFYALILRSSLFFFFFFVLVIKENLHLQKAFIANLKSCLLALMNAEKTNLVHLLTKANVVFYVTFFLLLWSRSRLMTKSVSIYLNFI